MDSQKWYQLECSTIDESRVRVRDIRDKGTTCFFSFSRRTFGPLTHTHMITVVLFAHLPISNSIFVPIVCFSFSSTFYLKVTLRFFLLSFDSIQFIHSYFDINTLAGELRTSAFRSVSERECTVCSNCLGILANAIQLQFTVFVFNRAQLAGF